MLQSSRCVYIYNTTENIDTTVLLGTKKYQGSRYFIHFLKKFTNVQKENERIKNIYVI